MKRRSGIILGAIVIVGLCVIVFLLKSEKLSGSCTYGDYKIEIAGSVYCKSSQIGYIDMQVRATGKQTDKLFHTSDDLLNNGFDFIIDDRSSEGGRCKNLYESG